MLAGVPLTDHLVGQVATIGTVNSLVLLGQAPVAQLSRAPLGELQNHGASCR